MCPYAWSPAYSVGNDLIDQQHQNLFALCQKIHDIQADSSADAIAQASVAIDALALYARTHFHVEEHLLRKHHYDDIDQHVREHRKFDDDLALIGKRALTGESGSGEIAEFVRLWLMNHILVSDMKYKSSIAQG